MLLFIYFAICEESTIHRFLFQSMSLMWHTQWTVAMWTLNLCSICYRKKNVKSISMRRLNKSIVNLFVFIRLQIKWWWKKHEHFYWTNKIIYQWKLNSVIFMKMNWFSWFNFSFSKLAPFVFFSLQKHQFTSNWMKRGG